MKTLAGAKMPSLKDKLLSQETTQVEKVVQNIKKIIKRKK